MDGHLAALEACAIEARRLTDGLSDDAINWRPGPDRWSVAECLLHLARTNGLYVPPLERVVREARERGSVGTGPFRPNWFGRWFAAQMEPPPKRRFKVPRAFRPPQERATVEAARRAYLDTNDAIQAIVRSAEGLDLGRIRMTSPLTRFMRFNLEGAFRAIVAHDRRHLWQARQVRETAGFPA